MAGSGVAMMGTSSDCCRRCCWRRFWMLEEGLVDSILVVWPLGRVLQLCVVRLVQDESPEWGPGPGGREGQVNASRGSDDLHTFSIHSFTSCLTIAYLTQCASRSSPGYSSFSVLVPKRVALWKLAQYLCLAPRPLEEYCTALRPAKVVLYSSSIYNALLVGVCKAIDGNA